MSVRYVADENGNRIAVLLDTKEYGRKLAEPVARPLAARLLAISSQACS